MNLNLRISITMIIFSLVMTGAFRAYRFFSDWGDKRQVQQEASAPRVQDSLSFFESGYMDPAAPPEKMKVELKDPAVGAPKTTSLSLVKPVFNPDAKSNSETIPFPGQTAEASAAPSNLDKYASNPIMASFTKELQQALGPKAGFKDVLKPDFDKNNANNPQVQKILLKYTKDPAFIGLMQEMMKDKEFMSAFEEQVMTSNGRE